MNPEERKALKEAVSKAKRRKTAQSGPSLRLFKTTGVTWDKNSRSWKARYGKVFLGRFKLEEDAIKARLEYERKHK